MKLSLRRPPKPVTPPAPNADLLIIQLSRDKADLRAELDKLRGHLADADATIAYQNGRMRDMAKELLGNQAVITRYQKVDAAPSTVEVAPVHFYGSSKARA